MRKLASFSLLATALACGATVFPYHGFAYHGLPSHGLPSHGGSPASLAHPQDPKEGGQGTQRLRDKQSQGGEAQVGDLELRADAVVRAVRKAADSVVSVYILHPNRLSRAAELTGQGSGVVLDASGLVITNWHVVAAVLMNPDALRVQIRMKNGKAYLASILSSSSEYDLALLQLDLPKGETVKPVEWGDSDTLMVGETMLAIGNPQGNSNSVTRGVLSATERTITVQAPDGNLREYKHLLQTDAAINQGNSGGALLDITGKLQGINNAMAVGAENIGFAIPVNIVKKVFEELLLSSEELADTWLGMKVHTADGTTTVYDVDPLGPAARAGIQQGDVVVEAGDHKVIKAVDYARALMNAKIGRAFPVQVLRHGNAMTFNPVPLSSADADLMRIAGLGAEEVSGQDDRRLVARASAELGVRRLPVAIRLTKVFPDSPAADLQLQSGDVLLSFSVTRGFGRPLVLAFSSLRDLAQRLRQLAGEDVQVSLLRGDEVLEGTIHLRPR